MRESSGFSVVECLLVLIMMSFLSIAMLSNWSVIFSKSAVKTQLQALVSTLQQIKSKAITEQRRVTICVGRTGDKLTVDGATIFQPQLGYSLRWFGGFDESPCFMVTRAGGLNGQRGHIGLYHNKVEQGQLVILDSGAMHLAE